MSCPPHKLSERRVALIDELHRLYSAESPGGQFRTRMRLVWKRFLWTAIVGGTTRTKRAVDIVAASAALLLLSPVFLIVAVAIKLTDSGPIIFWQTRVGQWGREFRFPKLRSMVVNAEALKSQLLQENKGTLSSSRFKMKRDPRITPVGRILRKFSIDELPQFWCVLKGDMSLVGPRPPLPSEVAQYSLHDRRRLDIKPGLTCFWQVNGRSDVSFQQQVDFDIQYVESRSLLLDFILLMKTIPAILTGRGAY
jgi:lipopolysaccharide/colanic/teichoic acid biosynthesis glycosyltransferase